MGWVEFIFNCNKLWPCYSLSDQFTIFTASFNFIIYIIYLYFINIELKITPDNQDVLIFETKF